MSRYSTPSAIFDMPKELVERALDVNVPWSFDDSNEESLLGEFQLDTERVKGMFSKDTIKKRMGAMTQMPGNMHKNRLRWYNFFKECLEPSYAKVPKDFFCFNSSNTKQFHVAYIFLACLIGGILLFFIENGAAHTPSLTFINACFIATSAICVTGLSTNDVSAMTVEAQVF